MGLALFLISCTALAENKSEQGKDKFFFTSNQNTNQDVNQPTYTDPEAITPEFCPYHIEGQPIGLSCLHCEHPNAYTQALQIAEILRNSCRKQVALSVLTDGTFGSNRNFLGELVRTITQYGAKLHLYVYLSNGPWQRRYGRMPNKGFGTNISPEEFRNKIKYDHSLREGYKAIIKYNEPLFDYANKRGASVYVLPMLEDNLDYSSAREMENLVRQTILPNIQYSLGRNPCPGCYRGNDDSLPVGLFLDQHINSDSDIIKTSNGLVVNDGKDFSFDWEYPNPNNLSFSRLMSYMDESKHNNNTFIIWNREYQGVAPSNVLNDPDYREYQLVTIAERDALVEVLRSK